VVHVRPQGQHAFYQRRKEIYIYDNAWLNLVVGGTYGDIWIRQAGGIVYPDRFSSKLGDRRKTTMSWRKLCENENLRIYAGRTQAGGLFSPSGLLGLIKLSSGSSLATQARKQLGKVCDCVWVEARGEQAYEYIL
jgi:hypothetical protein